MLIWVRASARARHEHAGTGGAGLGRFGMGSVRGRTAVLPASVCSETLSKPRTGLGLEELRGGLDGRLRGESCLISPRRNQETPTFLGAHAPPWYVWCELNRRKPRHSGATRVEPRTSTNWRPRSRLPDTAYVGVRGGLAVSQRAGPAQRGGRKLHIRAGGLVNTRGPTSRERQPRCENISVHFLQLLQARVPLAIEA